ncbi:MAG: Potassium channel protein [uncultured Frankineae bacterium]|uniref:Potassium channel protein n=1 Tax=uncultured Frankineae bacterium TaxID=437475 RepID=A0A6J4KLM7_9ACTN|nr:MAG: Potassium channel protein [uncultured Frankineae bacterium]
MTLQSGGPPRTRQPRPVPKGAVSADRGTGDGEASAAIFLLLRRMRVPLISLVLVFAVSVIGLALIPGRDGEGRPVDIGIFDAFYFMSYTATTIGFGELPYPFTDAQRLWVIVCIYSTVVAWAYAIGALLTLLQDRAFRSALAVQHFERKVRRLAEPFLLVAGYGETGELLVRSFDALGRRLVVLDVSADKIDALDLTSYRGDVPALVADARSPQQLRRAGLHSRWCEGVLALTDDDEANLAVVQSVALLRPDLPIVARTVSSAVQQRIATFGSPIVINPFDRFGEHLLLALRAPSTYRLMTWLEAGPGADLPPQADPPHGGRWIVCGYGRFGRAVTADLRKAGISVTVVEPSGAATEAVTDGVDLVAGDGTERGVLERTDPRSAVGLVAGTDNDTTNLSLAATARALNPDLFLIGRRNLPGNAVLYDALGMDAVLVPTELVAHEAYAHLSTPLLWRFLQEMPAQGDPWAARLLDVMVERCGGHLSALWKVRLTAREAPALQRWFADGPVLIETLMRSPENREQPLDVVVLMVLRGDFSILTPDAHFELEPDDQLLLAGRPPSRRALDSTLVVEPTCDYVMTGEREPVGTVWRALTADRRRPRGPRPRGGSVRR